MATSARTAWRTCRGNRWWNAFGKKKFPLGKVPGPLVHDDPVQRDSTAAAASKVWLTDIPPQAGGAPTSHRTDEGKLPLCAVKDAYSGRIVGYSMNSRMNARLAVNASNNAVFRASSTAEARGGDVASCIVHSDRGSQFRARRFVQALKRHDLVGSMGRVGAAGDNAAMESFFALLQKNVLDRRQWRTRDELRSQTMR